MEGKAPAIPAALRLYNTLISLKIKVVFLSGTLEVFREVRMRNLKKVGYHTWEKLILKWVSIYIYLFLYKSGSFSIKITCGLFNLQARFKNRAYVFIGLQIQEEGWACCGRICNPGKHWWSMEWYSWNQSRDQNFQASWPNVLYRLKKFWNHCWYSLLSTHTIFFPAPSISFTNNYYFL